MHRAGAAGHGSAEGLAEKVRLERVVRLACRLPYALEGSVRRALQEAGAALGEVRHGADVEIAFGVSEGAAAGLQARLNEIGQGALAWV